MKYSDKGSLYRPAEEQTYIMLTSWMSVKVWLYKMFSLVSYSPYLYSSLGQDTRVIHLVLLVIAVMYVPMYSKLYHYTAHARAKRAHSL